jgi:hypothetical protein
VSEREADIVVIVEGKIIVAEMARLRWLPGVEANVRKQNQNFDAGLILMQNCGPVLLSVNTVDRTTSCLKFSDVLRKYTGVRLLNAANSQASSLRTRSIAEVLYPLRLLSGP